jgi:muconate cycloisomerase
MSIIEDRHPSVHLDILTVRGIGLAASIHLYSTLELLLPAELNGPKFLENLFVDGLVIREKTVTVPDGPGLGVS